MRNRIQAKGLVFVDLDSTLANTQHRHHMIDTEDWQGTDWEAYSAASADDEVIEGVAVTVRQLFLRHAVVIVSGRNDTAMDTTRAWLWKNEIPFDSVVLRTRGDDRPNEQYKVEMMQAWLKQNGRTAPDLVIDDWPPLAPYLEKLGWPLLLVNPNYPIPDDVASRLLEMPPLIDNCHRNECESLKDEIVVYPDRCNCPVRDLEQMWTKIERWIRRYETQGAP